MNIKINQKVLVKIRYNGSGFKERAAPQVQVIVHVYPDNKVKTTSGDVWIVKPYNGQEANFLAIQ